MPQQANPNNQIQDSNIEILKQYAAPQKNKKKIFMIVGGIAVSLLLLIGLLAMLLAQPTQNTTTQETTISFWGRSVDESVMADIIAEFQSENPLIKVNYIKQSDTEYKERMKTRLTRQDPSALPDLMEVDENWVGELYQYLDVVTNEQIYTRYSDKAKENNQVSNFTYGIPYKFDSIALAYNKQYLGELGLSETDFSRLDWTALKERAKKLTKTKTVTENGRQKTTLTRGGMAIGDPLTVTNADKILELLLIQNDANLYNSQTRTFKLDNKFAEVMNFYTEFAREKAWNNTLGNDLDAFANGNLAMILVTTKDIDYIKSKNPGLNFVTVLPARIASIRNISLSRSLVLPRVKSNKDAVMKFAEYLTRVDTGTKLYTKQTKNTFVPAQLQSLNQIPKTSPFAIFSDINPNAEKFVTPNYETTSKVLKDFLRSSFSANFIDDRDLILFKYEITNLERSLNNSLKTTPTP